MTPRQRVATIRPGRILLEAGEDFMSTEHEAMKLPPNMTCADCAFFRWCKGMVGATVDWTSCDWYPRRFVQGPATVKSPARISTNERR